MTKIAGVISFITLILLASEFFESGSQLSKANRDNVSQRLVEPITIANELLIVEKEWLALQAQADLDKANKLLAKQNKNEVDNNDNTLLKIGEGQYQLLGIFVNQDNPFILVKEVNKTAAKKQQKKTSPSSVVKVLLGEELSTGIVLTELTSDRIKLQGKDEIFEFKLFERASNETK